MEPNKAAQNAVKELIRSELKKGASTSVSPDVVISTLTQDRRMSTLTVREAIWRLADLHEIEFTNGRQLTLVNGNHIEK